MNKLILSVLFAVLMATGCSTGRSWAGCDLLLTAFQETDELAPAWYQYTAEELRACGIKHIPADAANGRGKS